MHTYACICLSSGCARQSFKVYTIHFSVLASTDLTRPLPMTRKSSNMASTLGTLWASSSLTSTWRAAIREVWERCLYWRVSKERKAKNKERDSKKNNHNHSNHRNPKQMSLMCQVYHLSYLEWLGAEGFWFPQDRDHCAAVGVTEEQSQVPKCILGEIQESMNGRGSGGSIYTHTKHIRTH